MQHIDNLMGEQGGAIISAAGTASFTSSSFGEAQVKGFIVLEDGTLVSGLVMPNLVGGATYYDAYAFDKGDIVYALCTAGTVTAGAIQVLLHKKSTI